MNTFTTVAFIAALALATQAFAMGGGSRGGQTMSSTMSTPAMTTGSRMMIGTHTMNFAAPMNGAGTMTTTMSTTMSTTGMAKSQMTPVTPGTQMHQAVAN